MFFLVPLIPALTVTIGEAVAYATACVVTGYVAKTAYDSVSDRDGGFERQGESRAKAEYDTRLSRFERAMQEMRAHDKHYFDVILAVATVGYAYAARNGEVFLAPPDVNTAYENAMALAPNAIELCDMIIDLLAEKAEGSSSLTRQKFVSSWNQLKAAA